MTNICGQIQCLSSYSFVADVPKENQCSDWGVVRLAEKMWPFASNLARSVLNRRYVRRHLLVVLNRTNHCMLGQGCDCVVKVVGISKRLHGFTFTGVPSVVLQSDQLLSEMEKFLSQSGVFVRDVDQVATAESSFRGQVYQQNLELQGEVIYCPCPAESTSFGLERGVVHDSRCPVGQIIKLREVTARKAKDKAEQFMLRHITVFGEVLTLVDSVCTYFQDVQRKWVYSTDKEGHCNLLRLTSFVSERMSYLLQGEFENLDELENCMDEARRIYESKPSKYVEGTWSSLEYTSPFFQVVYMRYKCIQRYTEVYNMLHRAYDQGLLSWMCNREVVTFVSYGCGPAFELHAVRDFLLKYYPSVFFHGIGVDIEPTWEMVVVKAGFSFQQGDFACEVTKKEVDYVILSGVLYSYLRNTLISHIDLWYEAYSSLRGIFVNDRPRTLISYNSLCSYIVSRLIGEGDDRQICVLRSEQRDLSRYVTRPSLPLLYPNVPYLDSVDSVEEGDFDI